MLSERQVNRSWEQQTRSQMQAVQRCPLDSPAHDIGVQDASEHGISGEPHWLHVVQEHQADKMVMANQPTLW